MATPKFELGASETIKVDKNVPLPPSRVGASKYPWRDMKVGDSFWIPKTQSAMSSTMSAARRRLGYEFTSRVENGGTRIWRIK